MEFDKEKLKEFISELNSRSDEKDPYFFYKKKELIYIHFSVEYNKKKMLFMHEAYHDMYYLAPLGKLQIIFKDNLEINMKTGEWVLFNTDNIFHECVNKKIMVKDIIRGSIQDIIRDCESPMAFTEARLENANKKFYKILEYSYSNIQSIDDLNDLDEFNKDIQLYYKTFYDNNTTYLPLDISYDYIIGEQLTIEELIYKSYLSYPIKYGDDEEYSDECITKETLKIVDIVNKNEKNKISEQVEYILNKKNCKHNHKKNDTIYFMESYVKTYFNLKNKWVFMYQTIDFTVISNNLEIDLFLKCNPNAKISKKYLIKDYKIKIFEEIELLTSLEKAFLLCEIFNIPNKFLVNIN